MNAKYQPFLLSILLIAPLAEALVVDSVTPGLNAEPIAISATEGISREFAISASAVEAIAYQWTVDGEGAGTTDSLSYTPDFDVVIHPSSTRVTTISCVLQAGGESATVTWDAVTIHDTNRAPQLNGGTALVAPTTATLGTPLICTLSGRGLDPDAEDNADLRYVFTWYGTYLEGSCDPDPEVENIIDAPAAPLENPANRIDENSAPYERGQAWRCEVQVLDSSDARSAITEGGPATVVNTPPVVGPFALFTDDPPTMNSSLFARPDSVTDVEGDSIGFIYEWRVNGATLPDEFTEEIDNFPSIIYIMGDRITAAVTPFDDFDQGATQVSAETKIPIAWEMAFHVDQSGTDTVVIGMHDDAEDGPDDFDNSGRDIRGTTHNNQLWDLTIDCRAGARTLLWYGTVVDLRTLAQAYDHRLTIFTEDNLPIFINRTGSLTLPEGSVHTLRVEMHKAYQVSLKLHSGWNLFSLPLGADSTNTSGLPSPALSYVPDVLVRSPQLQPLVGYWAHCPRSVNVLQSAATLSSESPQLQPGWNLIGVGSHHLSLANHPEIVTAWEWDAKEQAYRWADMLFPGRGYWVYANATIAP
jgi:hypothetical protein